MLDLDAGILSNAPPDKHFILKNGRVLKNLYELTNSLISLDDETFNYHVNSEKNDFENWIRHTFNDGQLADQISKLKSRELIVREINQRLAAISRPVKKEHKKLLSYNIAKPQQKEEASNTKEDTARKDSHEILKKVEEMLVKEKELVKREEKILEIEERIENQLVKGKSKNEKFFSKEFVQGLVTGLLITMILSLLYIKFYY